MREEKYFITNEYGEVVRVTKEEHEKWSEENKDEKKTARHQNSKHQNKKKKEEHLLIMS